MDWTDAEHRMALVRVLVEGKLTRSGHTAAVVDYLLELGWVMQMHRPGEVALSAGGEQEIRFLLDRCWPDWQLNVAKLLRSEAPLNATAFRAHQRGETIKGLLDHLPGRLHRKTFAAIVGEHSKANIPELVQDVDLELELTGDDVLRIRCNRGLQLKRGSDSLFCCDNVMDFLGEVAFPERAFSEPFTPVGILPRAIMTIENLGAYVDLPMPETLLVIHQPGWNCNLSLRFMGSFPSDTPLYHFGDLDPGGLKIYQYLRRVSGREIQFFVPDCWRHYLDSHARALKNPWGSELDGCPVNPLLDELMASRRWLEQEVVLADPALKGELAALVQVYGADRLPE